MKEYPLIAEAHNLSIGYKGKRGTNAVVHSGINFSLHGGELVCLLGANGAGKSTLLRTMAAVQPALVGDISLMGRPCQSYSERERSRLIGIVLTERTHAGGLTVRELVALGRQPYTGFFGRLNKADEEKIDYAIQAVGMCNKACSYVAELSDGERQKAMIAKALVQECPLILLDEPTAFLDVVSRIEIMTLLHKLAVEEGRAILLSTHDVEQALVLADKLWLLSKESGLVCGNTEDLILSNAMDKLFPHEEICFDLLHGGYSPVVHGDKSLLLSAADDVLLHWTRNALNRNGWLGVEVRNEESVLDMPRLEVRSADCLLLTSEGKTHTYTTYQQMLDALKILYSE